MILNKLFDYNSQCQYLQLEKPSGFEIELPIQKTLAISLLKGMAKRTPPLGLIGLRGRGHTQGHATPNFIHHFKSSILGLSNEVSFVPKSI